MRSTLAGVVLMDLSAAMLVVGYQERSAFMKTLVLVLDLRFLFSTPHRSVSTTAGKKLYGLGVNYHREFSRHMTLM